MARLFTVLTVLMFLALLAPIALATNYNDVLKNIGIAVPEELVTKPTFTIEYRASSVDITSYAKFTLINVKPSDTYIALPGYPLLPVKVYTFTIEGYAKDVKVHAIVGGIEVVKLDKPIIPASKPLPWCIDLLKYGEKDDIITIDKNVYSKDAYLPGWVVHTEVMHGLWGKTLIVVYVAPVLYNPAKNVALIVKDVKVYIEVGEVKKVEFQTAKVLILTSKPLIGFAKMLAELYSKIGFDSEIVTVEEIWKEYKPAENITMYPGFYTYKGKDPIYSMLVKNYNWTLALKIISFLRKHDGEFGLITIIGDAKTVPPSFYYVSMTAMKYIGPYDAWNPTDFFYASYDYDLLPNVAVARIPFSDPKMLDVFYKKLVTWYENFKKRKPFIALSGGYPFLRVMMFGEHAISKILARSINNTPVMYLIRTDGTYTAENVKKIVSGASGAIWYFALAHGSGTALMDPLLVGFRRYTFEKLVDVSDLMSMKPNVQELIVSSVACRNAIWDQAVVMFSIPLSFGQAVLVSPAPTIAYVGSARIAWEILGLPVSNKEGIIALDYFGATRLHECILRAYDMAVGNLAGKVPFLPLSVIVAYGQAEYIKEAMAGLRAIGASPEDYDIAMLTFFQLSTLGDAALPVPIPEKPVAIPKVKKMKPLDYDTLLKIQWAYEYTELPFYKYPKEIKVKVDADKSTYLVKVVRIWPAYSITETVILNFLAYVKPVYVKLAQLPGVVSVKPSIDISGLLATYVQSPASIARVYTTSAGLYLEPPAATAGSPITIKGFGLDITGARMLDLYIAGRYITSLPIPPTGYITWQVALPYLAPGKFKVTLSLPSGYYGAESISELLKLLTTEVTVYVVKKLDIVVTAPDIIEVGKEIPVVLTTLVEGKPVKADVEVKVECPEGVAKTTPVEEIAPGVLRFYVKFDTPGICIVTVEGKYEAELVKAYGKAVKTLVGVEKAYTLSKLIEESRSEIVSKIKEVSTGITEAIEKTKAELAKTIETMTTMYTSKLAALNKTITAGFVTLTSEVAKTREEVVKSISEAEKSLANEITKATEDLKAALKDAVEAVTKAIEKSTAEVKSSVEEVKAKLKEVSKSITETVKSEAEKLSGEIASTEKKLEGKITEEVGNLAKKVSDVEKSLKSYIDTKTGELSDKIEKTKSDLEASISTLTGLTGGTLALVIATLGVGAFTLTRIRKA